MNLTIIQYHGAIGSDRYTILVTSLKFTNTKLLKQLDTVPLLFCVDEVLVLLGRIERGLIVYSGQSYSFIAV